jgi:hypothetical protein
MTFDIAKWHSHLTVRRGLKRDIPSAREIRDGYGTYYVFSGTEDAEYMRACRLAMDHNKDPNERARERLRAKRAAEVFTEIWMRRMAGESLEDIEKGEAA